MPGGLVYGGETLKKRFLSLCLAGILAFGVAFGVLPIRAGAVLPVGFVESAFASYAMSSGYTFFSEEMDDPLFLGLFRELYDDFIGVQAAIGRPVRGWDEYDDSDVFIDNAGNIVISYDVALEWAIAIQWIKTHFDIEDGSSTPVTVVSGDSFWTDGNGVTAVKVTCSEPSGVSSFPYRSSVVFGTGNISSLSNYYYTLISQSQGEFLATYRTDGNNHVFYILSLDSSSNRVSLNMYNSGAGGSLASGYANMNSWLTLRVPADNWDVDLSIPFSSVVPSSVVLSPGIAASLAASIAQSVIDVAQGITDDDSIVIGVGAVPGITESEMADFVADGIRADTLEPTATITATDVIDTPVQPYPDIDGLGLPSLGAALTSRFPFCIPWDFVDTVQLLAADPVAPDFSFDLLPQRIRDYCHITAPTEVRFNMGDPKFSKVGVFCRWGSLISFCFGLAVLTKRMIWTA